MAAEIPQISISLDDSITEQDSETKGLCIDDAKTDVEDLDSDTERKMSNGLLPEFTKKPRGSVTDVENFTSDNEHENYDNKDYDAKITLDEFLDQGQVDESAAYFGTKKKDMPKMKSKPKEMGTNLLVVNDGDAAAGVTDCEDMLDSGPEEEEPEIKYEYDDKPIVLEDGGSVNIHDANKKRSSNYIPKMKQVSSDSSDDEPPNPKVRHPPRHHLHSKQQHHPRSIQDAKSDVENMMFSDDEKKPRKASAPMINVEDADEVTFEASDAEDMDPGMMKMSKSMTFPEINITFAMDMPTSDSKVDKNKPACALGVPANKDDALTDVEDLDSNDSDDDNEGASAYPKCKLWKHIIPKAVIKDHRDTDEEDMGQMSDVEGLLDPCLGDDIDVPLPSPHRELKIVKDNENGQPQVSVLPIGDNFTLGIDSYADGGVTDCEDCADENDDAENYDDSKYALEKLPEIDGGSVESADKTIDKNQPSRPVSSMSSGNLCVQVNDNPVTDTEEIMISNAVPSNSNSNPISNVGSCELRRRRGKGKTSSSKNSGFLIVSEKQEGGHTDVEEMDFDEDEHKSKFDAKRRPTIEIATIMNSNDTMTDEECFSGGEECMAFRKSPDSRPLSALNQENYCSSITSMDCLDANKPEMKNNRRLAPIIRKISPSPDTMMNPVTDTEDILGNSDLDEPYSRAQTATPNEVQKVLQDTLENSEIHEAHKGAFDSRKERKHLKDPRELDAHTDVSDIELPVGNANDLIDTVHNEAHNLVDSVLEASVEIVSNQLTSSEPKLTSFSLALNNNTMATENGSGSNLEVQPPTGINVIVRSPTIESLTNKSFEEYVVNSVEVEKEAPPKTEPPKPKRRFVFTDSVDEAKEVKPKEKKAPSSRVDRKFERLSSDIDDLETKENEFEATFADVKDDGSGLQSEFSKISWGDDSNSQATTGDEFASSTPDDGLQGDASFDDAKESAKEKLQSKTTEKED